MLIGREDGREELLRRQGEDGMRRLLHRIGRAVGALHKAGVVHGDLTTSNLILRREGDDEDEQPPSPSASASPPPLDGPIALIDFGLASQSTHEEDRAVDLYVLERAFGSSHPRTEKLFLVEVLGPHGYAGSYKGAAAVLRRLADVRLRGRKRSMIG